MTPPGTDSLGGSGLAGNIDFHWWARFGNALLFTLVQDGFDFAMTKQTENSGGVNYYQNSQDGMEKIIEEAMRQSGNIPPTLTKIKVSESAFLLPETLIFRVSISLIR